MHGLDVHHAKVTRPCLAKLTGGALPCSLCEAKVPRRWRGYCPGIAEGGKRSVFLVGAETGSVLSNTAPGTWVTLRRGAWGTAPVTVSGFAGRVTSTFDVRFAPTGIFSKGTDLWPWLLRLWGDADLEAFYRSTLARKGA